MVKAAADMPHDWIMKLKSRAISGEMPSARVMTGNAMAPPPSLVIPESVDVALYVCLTILESLICNQL